MFWGSAATDFATRELERATMDIRPDHAPCRTSLPVFAGDESGGAIVLGLVFFTLMIMMGGLAVDLMRFEHTRTTLQQTTDRAVLAAAAMGVSSVLVLSNALRLRSFRAPLAH